MEAKSSSISPVGVDWLQAQDAVEVESKPGLPPEELAKVVGEYDGMIIRSGAKVAAEVLANPGKLKAIARAGVGVDNVDVPVATTQGVIVMNTPGGNTVSTAELALTLMMALSRKIAPDPKNTHVPFFQISEMKREVCGYFGRFLVL